MRTRAGLAALVALVLAGCTSPDAGPTPEEEVTALLEELATSTDPELCERAYTPKALRQVLGNSDLQACREAMAAQELSGERQVSDVVVDGDRATAVTTTTGGGNSDGMLLTVELVRSSEGWRMDGTRSVEIVDRAAVDARTSVVIQASGATLMTPDQLACVDGRMRAASDEELEAVYGRGQVQTILVDGIRDCVGGGVDLAAILLMTSYQLQQAGLSQEASDCVAGAGIIGYGDLTLEEIIASPDARAQWHQSLLDAAKLQLGGGVPLCAETG